MCARNAQFFPRNVCITHDFKGLILRIYKSIIKIFCYRVTGTTLHIPACILISCGRDFLSLDSRLLEGKGYIWLTLPCSKIFAELCSFLKPGFSGLVISIYRRCSMFWVSSSLTLSGFCVLLCFLKIIDISSSICILEASLTNISSLSTLAPKPNLSSFL